MPYVDVATGQTVDSAIAAFPDGRPKPGYREQMGPGDYISFDLAFADTARGGRGSVYLIDNHPTYAHSTAHVRDAALGRTPLSARPMPRAADIPIVDADCASLAAVRDAARRIARYN